MMAFGDWIGREQGVFDQSIREWPAFAEEHSAARARRWSFAREPRRRDDRS
jgi:hypothetical protein